MAVSRREKLRRLRDAFTVLFEDGMLLTGEGRLYQALADEIVTNAPREIFTWLAGFQGMEEWVGERTLSDMKTYEIEVQPKKYQGALTLDRDDFDDDRFGMYIRQVQQMAEEYNRLRRRLIAELLKNGENSDPIYDGEPFFGDRTNEFGRLQSNLTENAALDVDTFYEVFEKMETLRNDADKLYNIKPDMLITSPAQRQAVDSLFKNIGAQRVYDGNATPADRNNDNLLFGMIPEGNILIDPYLEGDDFYLVDSSTILKPILSTVRDQLETDTVGPGSEFAFKNDAYLWGIRARFEVTYGVWMPIHKVTVA
jgi:phage major head subunit gpT-like protein